MTYEDFKTLTEEEQKAIFTGMDERGILYDDMEAERNSFQTENNKLKEELSELKTEMKKTKEQERCTCQNTKLFCVSTLQKIHYRKV